MTRTRLDAQPFDVAMLRRDFPILQRVVHKKPLVYLDNAATTQKPRCVIDAVSRYYETTNSNVHRGVHKLSQEATDAYEGAREIVQKHINAASEKEVIWVRGATEAINLVAQTFGRSRLHAGDEVLISALEHHANIVPWQMLCDEKQAKLRVIPMNERGELDQNAFRSLLSSKTKLLAISHVSNALGTVNPITEMIADAHRQNIPVLVDGSQGAPHLAIDVRALDCEFYVFSGHKVYAPTGIGILYGKQAVLESMPPWQGGGDMILSVSFAKTTYNQLPWKFEAGTPDIAGAIGLGEALKYLNRIGLDRIAAYEHELLAYATERFSTLPGLRIIGTAAKKASVLSFLIAGVHAHDVGTILDREGVAIRAGHHCAQPVMEAFCIPATARASFAFYNTMDEVDTLVGAVKRTQEIFGS